MSRHCLSVCFGSRGPSHLSMASSTREPAWRRSPGAGGQGASASFLHQGADAESAFQGSLSPLGVRVQGISFVCQPHAPQDQNSRYLLAWPGVPQRCLHEHRVPSAQRQRGVHRFLGVYEALGHCRPHLLVLGGTPMLTLCPPCAGGKLVISPPCAGGTNV